MAKYIKQEMADLHGTGRTQAYYRMQVERNMDFEEFVERCTLHGGMQRSAIVGVLTHVCHELALQMADGYSVTIDGLGTFRPRLGLRPEKEQDSFEEGQRQHNALSIGVCGVNYRADKELVNETDDNCLLERGGASRLRRSAYTPEERIAMARQYLSEHPVMRTADYAALTGLSPATATRELLRLSRDSASGIAAQGRRSAKVYVLRQEADDTEDSD